jgi:ketosteroid isomerase-like protein
MSQDNVELVRASLEAWNKGDADGWLRPAHPEIEFSSDVARRVEGAETVYRGSAGLRRFWDDFRSVWDLTIEVSDVRDLGDTVVALGRVRTRGEASGIGLAGPVAYVFEFEDGLARKVRAYLEPREALEAVGLSE